MVSSSSVIFHTPPVFLSSTVPLPVTTAMNHELVEFAISHATENSHQVNDLMAVMQEIESYFAMIIFFVAANLPAWRV